MGGVDVAGGSNASLFLGLPGGIRYNGKFRQILQYGNWWTISTIHGSTGYRAVFLILGYGDESVALGSPDVPHEGDGLSVRCIKG